jgi:hypothetical protein
MFNNCINKSFKRNGENQLVFLAEIDYELRHCGANYPDFIAGQLKDWATSP